MRQQYFNPDNNQVVPKDDMVKGYQFAKNQFVVFEPDELKVLEQPKTDAIEIAEFVPAEQVERVYFDRAYYLGPDRGGARAYRLLAAALEQTGRVAVARFATRGKQYLVMVRPYRDGLMLEQLRYQTEVRSWDEVPVEEGEINPAELDLAVQMIEQKDRGGIPARRVQGRSARAPARADPAEDRRRTDHRGALGRTAGPDHRPDGGAEGEHRG